MVNDSSMNVAPSLQKIASLRNSIARLNNRRQSSIFNMEEISERDGDGESHLSFSCEGSGHKKQIKYENTYKMQPRQNPTWFGPSGVPRMESIREMASNVLESALQDEEYEMFTVRKLSASLADEIKSRVRGMDAFPKRYKVMVMVYVGQRAENLDIRIASRTLSLPCDSWCDATYQGKHLYASAQIYMMYQE